MNQRAQYLKAMGIQQWLLRDVPDKGVRPDIESDITETTSPLQAKPAETAPQVAANVNPVHVWTILRDEVRDCTQCSLHESRTQAVFGVGDHNADWLVIGEAPGAEEDKQGEPFVGAAGQLLTVMLKAIDLARDEVYIANVLKCRPPNNRDPHADEIAACDDYLQRQISLIKPRIIVAFGRVAAQSVLKTTQAIGKLRGQVHRLSKTDIPVIVTYHPSYLLRIPREKRKSWEDLKLARQTFMELAK